MKKIFGLLIILCISVSIVYANEPQLPSNIQSQMQNERIKKQIAFEERLGLTETQKQQAKVLRRASFEKIHPIMKEIHSKREDIRQTQNLNIDIKLKKQKITDLEQELSVLEKQAHKIRHQNMKDFENLLTDKQKKILKQMKKEGEKNYQKHHPPRPIM